MSADGARLGQSSEFTTEITLSGPLRSPRQMLGSQVIRGHASLHDDAIAASLGITGAPIEAPTHFSQFDPLAYRAWGPSWFERGCLSCHFRTMVAEGEQVRASMTVHGPGRASIEACKADGATVLVGTASLGPSPTELGRRQPTVVPAGLRMVDQLEIGMSKRLGDGISVTFDDDNGPLYPFTLREKLARITEPHDWYTEEGGRSSPWGRAILPFEMISVLAHKVDPLWPIETLAVGLFLDLEIRLLAGPVFVGQEYIVDTAIVGLSESRRTESYWTLTTLRETLDGEPAATVLLHAGLFKDSAQVL